MQLSIVFWDTGCTFLFIEERDIIFGMLIQKTLVSMAIIALSL